MPSFDDWRDSVQFTPGGMAYRRGEILVRESVVDVASSTLERILDASLEGEVLAGEWVRLSGVPETLEALGHLWGAGVAAQPNHALFANACCPPHPSTLPLDADPFLAHPFLAHPFLAHPFLAHPFLAHPFLAHPFLAHGGGCCCCGGGGGGIAAKPFLAHSNPAAVPKMQATGAGRSSARPARAPKGAGKEYKGPETGVRIAILDTGWAKNHTPTGLPSIKVQPHGGDPGPDEDGDQYLDPVAGHGTFIAGVIEQIAPGCDLEVHEVLSTYGHGYEQEIGQKLHALAARPKNEKPHIVNLSFGGYTIVGMQYLADAVAKLQQEGILVVASAGNEATCTPTFPAALPDVIGVGALDADGWPAEYTNYGPWVRACTVGTDVVSIFFEGFNGAEPVVAGEDIDDFKGWAKWSGTSFSTPRVAAALALELADGKTAAQAVKKLIDNEKADKRPMLGTVVLP